ncbi:MAG: hypothetical protein HY368_03030 [Candidatus Aenigmarchaeota archaeon]|nr:hypothetical protein [Candidatus Aenigmarchaeota archaeon]
MLGDVTERIDARGLKTQSVDLSYNDTSPELILPYALVRVLFFGERHHRKLRRMDLRGAMIDDIQGVFPDVREILVYEGTRIPPEFKRHYKL